MGMNNNKRLTKKSREVRGPSGLGGDIWEMYDFAELNFCIVTGDLFLMLDGDLWKIYLGKL